jgi:hypothetical protein
LGETRIYSGQQLFNKLNNNLTQVGSSTLETCPTPQSFPSLIVSVAANTTTDNLLEVGCFYDGGIVVPTNFVLVVQATTSLSAGITAPQQGLFKKLQIANAGAETEELDIVDNYNLTFGALVTGDTIFVQAFLVNTISGEASIKSFAKSTRIA